MIYEVVMKSKRTGRIWNGFYPTLREAKIWYYEWTNAGFEGDVFRRDYE